VIRVRLSDAQLSAIECRDPRPEDDPVLSAAWDGGRYLEFEPGDAEALDAELTEAANGEDAERQLRGPTEGKLAGRASWSLTHLSKKVLKSARQSADT